MRIRDLVVATEAYSFSTFTYSFSKIKKNMERASAKLLDSIKSVKSEAKVHFGPVLTSDVFDVYSNGASHVLKELGSPDTLATEMETFALYHIGQICKIDTASILTIVDSKYEINNNVPSEDREKSLDDMISIALEALIKL